jgi:hypothetical protein
MRDMVSGVFVPVDELALTSVAALAALDSTVELADVGFPANLDSTPRFVIAGGVVSQARNGFFKLPGLTGLTGFLRAETFGVAPAASSRNEAVRSCAAASSCGVDSISSDCIRWNG